MEEELPPYEVRTMVPTVPTSIRRGLRSLGCLPVSPWPPKPLSAWPGTLREGGEALQAVHKRHISGVPNAPKSSIRRPLEVPR